MKKTFIWLVASLLFTMVGCVEGLQESGVTETSSEQLPNLTAGFAEEETKTYVESGKYLRWHEDDRLTAFFGNTRNRQYKFDGATGDNSGSFSYVSSGNLETGNDLDRIYAVYPYDETATITDDGQISLTLPAVQNYADNSFGRGANTMLAVTENVEDTFLGFKNSCGYLKLKLYNPEGATIKSVEVKGNGDEKIAGAATATIAFGEVPQLTMADEATTAITLDCGDGVILGTTAEAATEFWVVIPETTFEGGITITVTDTEGSIFEKSTTKKVVIERNAVQPMAALGVEFVAPVAKPANNEIWYTNGSTTEATKPYKTDVFGANIVSNTYDTKKECWVIKFDGEVTSIGGRAFYNCGSLISVTIPDNVTSIGNEAFYYCSNLQSVIIPDSVTDIKGGAFYYCSSLKNVYCKAITPPKCDGNIFCYYDDYEETTCYEMVFGGSVYVPSVSVSVYKQASVWSVEDIVGYDFVCDEIATDEHVPANNEIWYTSTAKVEPYKADDFGVNIQSNEWDERTGKGVITFEGYVTKIGDYAFNDCTMLTSVTIPDSVTEIGIGAFRACSSLTFVTIPDGLTTIGIYAFNACSSLKLFSGKIASSDGRCLIINGELKAFAPAGLTRYSIPWGVTSIDYGTFHGCTNLTSVVIREDVTTIEDYAFYYCTSLTSVYCNPTTPPSLGVHVFDHAASGSYEIIPCNIYVPANSVEAYKTSMYWKKYASNIVGR